MHGDLEPDAPEAMVVYESVFGDARAIAQAVADGLSSGVRTRVVAAADAPREIGPEVRLLVVGAPNHAFGLPRPSTRQSAVEQHGASIADTRTGMREWLESVRNRRSGLTAVAFDTRSSTHRVLTRMDHAARTEEQLLTALGAHVVAPAEHFFVSDVQGPLVDGEQQRARRWGQSLVELVADIARS